MELVEGQTLDQVMADKVLDVGLAKVDGQRAQGRPAATSCSSHDHHLPRHTELFGARRRVEGNRLNAEAFTVP
jgi:hypothetical protein